MLRQRLGCWDPAGADGTAARPLSPLEFLHPTALTARVSQAREAVGAGLLGSGPSGACCPFGSPGAVAVFPLMPRASSELPGTRLSLLAGGVRLLVVLWFVFSRKSCSAEQPLSDEFHVVL